MGEQVQNWIQMLETEWQTPGGFLGKARKGIFAPQQGTGFTSKLESIKLPQDTPIDRRLVSLLWYMPLFLGWQKKRVVEKGGDLLAFEQLTNRVEAIVGKILGVP